MFSKISRKAAAIGFGLSLATVVATCQAGPASAGTSGCLTGTYATYCGALTDQESPVALSVDAYRQGAVAGNKVIGYYNSDGDKATDFAVFSTPGGVFIEYAPDGVASNLCLSEPYQDAGIVLRVCNGSDWQHFTETSVYAAMAPATGYTATAPASPPASPGFVLTDKATGDVITANGLRGQLTGVAAPAAGTNYAAAEVFQHWLG
jgi:hypothetical protein